MKRYQKYIPNSAKEIKVSYDDKLGTMAEELFDLFDSYDLIEPKHALNKKVYSENGSYYLTGSNDYWTFMTPEYNHKHLKDELPQEVSDYYFDKFLPYLELDQSDWLRVDKMQPQPNIRDLIHKGSRVPGILGSKEFDNTFWQSGVFHMDYGFRRDQYKFIIYANDVEEGSGGTVFTEPIISPFLDDDTPRWEGSGEELKLNVEEVKTTDLNIKEISGPKGSIVCFNSHVAHSARGPKDGIRKAIHLVVNGPSVKPYDRPNYFHDFKKGFGR